MEGCFQKSTLQDKQFLFETGGSPAYFHHPRYQSQQPENIEQYIINNQGEPIGNYYLIKELMKSWMRRRVKGHFK